MNLSRFKALVPWLAEKKYVWLSLGTNAIALIVALHPGATEPLIRLTGLTLSTALAALAPDGRRDGACAKCKGGVSISTAVGRARGFQTFGPGQNPNTDTRLDALEKNIAAIHERITATQKELDEEIQKSADALMGEAQARQTEDSEIRKKLEATGTGGVHISAIGASWLFVGVDRRRLVPMGFVSAGL